MTENPSEDNYVLGRGVAESVRLDAQHLLWKLHLGFALHPSLMTEDNMKIAELGCGTGVWLLDLAQELPSTVQLHGFDISNNQFPPSFLWPGNVSFSLLDSLGELPTCLNEQYDVVHVRMWASNLRGKDTGILIQNAKRMLKPGGYLQWEEADLIHQVVQTPLAERFERGVNELFGHVGLQYRGRPSWVHELPNSLKQHDLQILSHRQESFKSGLEQLATNTYLLALQEILEGIERTSSEGQNHFVQPHKDVLHLMQKSYNSGLVYNWGPLSILARKPIT